MSGVCYPDSLIGSIPNLYYYAANNPSEATIAKRRSYANTISYLTPPAENAGLYKGLKELKELISSYQVRDTHTHTHTDTQGAHLPAIRHTHCAPMLPTSCAARSEKWGTDQRVCVCVCRVCVRAVAASRSA